MRRFVLPLLLALLVALSLVACDASQVTDTGIAIETQVDPNLYSVELRLEEEVEGYSQTNASFVALNGYARGVMWQEGKGIVRGTLVSVNPDVGFVSEGDITIVKTTDWKVTGLLPGDTVSLVCIADFEPVCTKSEEYGQVGECFEMWEFDFCRLDAIIPASGR